ncbi:MAG TPA: FHA domain-containing protein, partial [Ktedonobacteraceae bacterium]|nr:FHA domain-containing protein [Ktedonobacteraceae bacterium]
MQTKPQVTGRVAIQFLNGPLAEKIIPLEKRVVTIGRDRQNDIVVLDAKVSRSHARLSWLDGAWKVENLSQRSFISIDQQRAEQGVLRDKNVVNLGEAISFIFLLQPLSVQTEFPASLTELAMHPTIDMEPISSLPKELPTQEALPGTMLALRVPTLTVSSNIHSERYVHPLSRPVISIGRNAENDIIIDEQIVSSRHVQVVQEDGKLFLLHPHPSRERTLNGLWYRGTQIAGDQQFRKQLMPGDIFRIGDEHGTLVSLIYDDGTGMLQDALSEMQPVPLTMDRITLGRTDENTVVLNHPQVSARHALLEKIDGNYQIVDTNSTNHVYVNDARISSAILHSGDEMRIGPFRLIYTGRELRPFDESSYIRIDALHLKKTGNKNVILLNDISLVIPPRKFVALVGGSGAGKSTLMDALNGLRPAHEGTVLYNSIDYYSNPGAFSTQLGYVPQDDIVHRDLTVERALYYAARLRLPGDFTREQIQQRIDEVLEDVEMTDRRYLLVSKLSGGQRKRVSIALELLANPGIFFLDEPTSGLDPGLDRKMMTLLRRLADRGRTIILVTHATNNINTCDYVCFLAQGGHLAYFGPPEEAKAFFNKTDFGEIYSSLEPTKAEPDIPVKAAEQFLASPDYQRYVAEPLQEGQARLSERSEQTGPARTRTQRRDRKAWSQFLLLSARYLLLLKNDRGNLLILLLQAPVIAIMLVLMVRFEVGAGVFDANNLVMCSTRALTPSGPLVLPQAQQSDLIACSQVLTFLHENPQGQAFVQQKGSPEQALQSFLAPGPGADAQKVLFIMAFATVLFGCINGAREIIK